MIKLGLTTINFGKDAIQSLASETKGKYHRALLVTGRDSIRKNGLYDAIVANLKQANITLVEFWNIKPNPTNIQIDEAAKLGREAKVDLIIAAGGGSAIDASKVIATMIANPTIEHSWDIVTNKAVWKNQPTPIISVITLAGTASEVNAGSVVTNEKEGLKLAVFTKAPILAIEDPTYTFSVSPWQTASGIFDCFSHITEQWFSQNGSFEWTDNYNIALLKTLISNAPQVLKNPHDYDARANILFTTSMALNGLSSFNMPGADWGIHGMAHVFAAKYDTTHGATLALITPTYWEEMAQTSPAFKERLLKLGKELFQTNDVLSTIAAVRNFIKLLNLPKTYRDFEVTKDFHIDHVKDLITYQFSHLQGEDMARIFKKIEV